MASIRRQLDVPEVIEKIRIGTGYRVLNKGTESRLLVVVLGAPLERITLVVVVRVHFDVYVF